MFKQEGESQDRSLDGGYRVADIIEGWYVSPGDE